MANIRSFRVRFEKQNRITFSDNLHEMTIRRRSDPVREDTVSQLSRALSYGTLIDPDTVRLLGQNLYELLFFHSHANEWFEHVYENSDDLRVVLEFHPDQSKLIAYPWEFLFAPKERWKEGGKYLLTQGRVSLVRRIVRRTAEARAVQRPRFLIVDCLPRSADPRGVALVSNAGRRCSVPPSAELDQLMVYLEGCGEVKCLRFPTHLQLMETVGGFEPDVVHLIGHGRTEGKHGGGFEFCLRPRGEQELERWERDERIAEAIGVQIPGLVLLQTCKGGKTDRYERYESAAVTLVKRGVPNVVALQHEIPLEDANRFVTGFYEALRLGLRLELAVKEGRQALRAAGVAAFGLPIVYVQRPESFALPREKADDGSGRTAAQDAAPSGPERAGEASIVSDEPQDITRPGPALGSAEPRRPQAAAPAAATPAQRNPLAVRLGRGET